METFDAYKKWLGIPPEEKRPVNYYRLLGIPLFESDQEVIANAADQRIAHVGSWRGKHRQTVERLQQELTTARVCLHNPEMRATYDRELRSQLADNNPNPSSSDQAVRSASVVVPQPIPVPGRCKLDRPRWFWPTKLGRRRIIGFVAGILVLGIVLMLFLRGMSDKAAQKDEHLASPATVKPNAQVTQPVSPPPKILEGPTTDGRLPLFDGNTLNGWHLARPGIPNCWSVQNGELVNMPHAAGNSNLVTNSLFRDFDLQLEFLMDDAGNSGVYLRGLYEVQLFDDNSRDLPANQRCGAIFKQYAPSEQAYLGPGKWNRLNVKMIGQRVTVTMNGKRIVEDADVNGPTDNTQTLSIKEGDRGPIMLQCMPGGAVRFRNISIRRIEEQTAVTATELEPQTPKSVRPVKASGKRPELVEVSELNDEGRQEWPSLTEDGLTIYWARDGSAIWTAHRDDPQSPFTNKKELFQGKMPAISSDGLEMILARGRTDGQEGDSLYVTTRTASDETFARPTEIPELREFVCADPSLSADGLTLFFDSRTIGTPRDQSKVVYCHRTNKSSSWTKPKRLPNVDTDDGVLWGPVLARDGLHLFLEHSPKKWTWDKTSFMLWSRASVNEPFDKYEYLQIGNLPPLLGGRVQYIAATKELFFHRFTPIPQSKKVRISIWVVKNFTLPVE